MPLLLKLLVWRLLHKEDKLHHRGIRKNEVSKVFLLRTFNKQQYIDTSTTILSVKIVVYLFIVTITSWSNDLIDFKLNFNQSFLTVCVVIKQDNRGQKTLAKIVTELWYEFFILRSSFFFTFRSWTFFSCYHSSSINILIHGEVRRLNRND